MIQAMNYTALIILACIFIPLERLFPQHRGQPILRKGWLSDLVYLLVNGWIVRFMTLAVIAGVMAGFGMATGGESLTGADHWPLAVQVVAVTVVADLGYYTAHRLSHHVPFLWRFHSVHHSSEQLDWLATYRVHFIDQTFTNCLSLLPVFFLGFSVQAVAIFALIYQAQAMLIHSNVRLRFGPLKWVFASPEYHHWHHANRREAYDRNFAAQLSIIDLLAGTMFLPRGQHPDRYGVDDPVPPQFHQQLLYPFRAAPAARAPAEDMPHEPEG